jgi:Fe-S-cluster containining protein
MDILTECRIGCAACCIAPSISSSIPGMEDGKPAGVRCVQLSDDNRCRIFGSYQRPAVCSSLRPTGEMCGTSTDDAMRQLTEWEQCTRPESS